MPAPSRSQSAVASAGRSAGDGSTNQDLGASPRRRRRALWFLAVIGAALILMPVAFQMFQRAPQGATMLKQFRPFMTSARLEGYQNDISLIGSGINQVDTQVGPYLQARNVISQPVGTAYPAYGNLDRQWPAIDAKMTDLLDKVQGNLGNYQAVAALPSFTLFPWFFVLPGIFILGASSALLLGRRRTAATAVLVAVGVGLVVAPAMFQMWSRAPKGGHMMTAFKNIETTSNVVTIQNDFSTMASGQGIIRLDLAPALAKAGMTPENIASRFPAVAQLDRTWVHVLNDMTPMIGAMSDNVTSYHAIAALPPFPLFPWFFVLPGLLVIGGVLIAREPRGETATAVDLRQAELAS
ncbi:MAG TPA: hypothetical protein VFZ97_19885 [Acidimicrobiales bacterium]